MKRIILVVLYAFMVLSAVAQESRQLYISTKGRDTYDGLSADKPWRTFSKVLANMQPGDVINIMPGTYSSLNNYKPVIDLKEENSGAEDRYITFKAYDPDNKPKLRAGGKGVWQCINIKASYIIIDGLEMEGNNQSLDSATADKVAYDYKYNNSRDWNTIAMYNTNGVSIGAGGKNTSFPNHVIIRNCVVHDFPGGGLGTQQSDYITFENNTVYNNAWFTMYGCSGISILNPVNSDDETGFKNIVVGNTVYNNHTKIKWYTANTPRYSDGNGIIMDVNNTPDASSTEEVIADGGYRAKTLVANNVSYFNGGSGIHAYKSHDIYIVNNTTFMNEQRYNGDYGEIFSQSGSNNIIINNIMYSKPNGKCTNFGRNGGATYINNVYYNGQLSGANGNFRNGDPLFVRMPSSPSDEADFHIKSSSPAIGFGELTDSVPQNDKDGVVRTTRVDCGAYQVNESTGISNVDIDKTNQSGNDIYNLSGQRISITYRGIILSKGKKYINK